MVRRGLMFGLAMTLVASMAAAQAPAGTPPTGAPPTGGRGGRGPQLVSPEVKADRTITLRYNAPNATSVIASGELDGKPHPLTKGADDLVGTSALAPDIYTYDSTLMVSPRSNAQREPSRLRHSRGQQVQCMAMARRSTTSKLPAWEVRTSPTSPRRSAQPHGVESTTAGYDRATTPVMYLLHALAISSRVTLMATKKSSTN